MRDLTLSNDEHPKTSVLTSSPCNHFTIQEVAFIKHPKTSVLTSSPCNHFAIQEEATIKHPRPSALTSSPCKHFANRPETFPPPTTTRIKI